MSWFLLQSTDGSAISAEMECFGKRRRVVLLMCDEADALEVGAEIEGSGQQAVKVVQVDHIIGWRECKPGAAK